MHSLVETYGNISAVEHAQSGWRCFDDHFSPGLYAHRCRARPVWIQAALPPCCNRWRAMASCITRAKRPALSITTEPTSPMQIARGWLSICWGSNMASTPPPGVTVLVEIRTLRQKVISDHEEMFAALKARDAERARKIAKEHVASGLKYWKKMAGAQASSPIRWSTRLPSMRT